MLALLSPAKKLDFERPLPDVAPTEPLLADRARELLAIARRRSEADWARLMDLSDDLARLTFERFRDLPDGPEGARPALLAFAGDVYQGLRAWTLSPGDLEWAQPRLAVLSGLYGFLRPLDRIHPYRLEMSTRLENPRGKDLYAYWRDALAAAVDRAVEGHGDPTVVSLASDEYSSAIDREALKAPVVVVAFQEVKDGRTRSPSRFVKLARGAMARWIVDHRIERARDLKEAEVDRFRFAPEASDDARYVFRRPQG